MDLVFRIRALAQGFNITAQLHVRREELKALAILAGLKNQST